MKLYAVSDLHLEYESNRKALTEVSVHPHDWLILAGDIGSTYDKLVYALEVLGERFARLIWVPGNHDLWFDDPCPERGEEKYLNLVEICRKFGVLTPEDPYEVWQGDGGAHYLVPLFLLYDYSFRPDSISFDKAVDWARESGIMCTDEYLLDPAPYSSRDEWCRVRYDYSEGRIKDLPRDLPTVLINHFPMRQDLIRIRRIPRFSIWCGTKRTTDWHTRFNASVVATGHLHVRATDVRDWVRFEEVSLGYPEDWHHERGIEGYLRQILPSPGAAVTANAGPLWRF